MFRAWASLHLYRVGSRVARAIPFWALPVVVHGVGAVLVRVMTGRRAVVRRNLARVLDFDHPGIDRAVRGAFRHYVHYWIESFRLPGTSERQLAPRLSYEGIEHLGAALRSGRGAILALPHLGSWDYAGAWMAMAGHPMTVVVEPLDPPRLFDWFVDLRRALGLSIVPLGPSAAPAVLQALRENRVVGLLSDRDLSGTGVGVELFGERTTLPGGPAILALRSGAPLLPTAAYSLPRGHHLAVVRPPISLARSGSLRADVARVTSDLAAELELLIRRAPDQWHLFQPNWPSDRRT